LSNLFLLTTTRSRSTPLRNTAWRQERESQMTALMSHVYGFCEQFARSWEASAAFDCRVEGTSVRRVLICGMGGSASAGEITARLADAMESRLPVNTLRGYSVPESTERDTLFAAVSYSGWTEETLSALRDAERRGMHIVVVTSGERLQHWAAIRAYPCYAFRYPAPPRHALSWMMPPVLRVVSRLGGWHLDSDAMHERLRRVDARVGELHELARGLAARINGRPVIVTAAEFLTPVARRWKNQLNENAKHVAFADELPEGNHNTIMGLEFPSSERLCILFLASNLFHERVQKLMEIAPDMMKIGQSSVAVIQIAGADKLEQILNATLLGDLVSLEVARMNGVDPLNIDRIDALKSLLKA
jgi:glucose/mannose-6-phosphate isomerase